MHLQKTVVSIALLLLLTMPTVFADDVSEMRYGTDSHDSHAEVEVYINPSDISALSIEETCISTETDRALASPNPIDKALSLAVVKPGCALYAFTSTLNDLLNFFVNIILYASLISIFLFIQTFFIKLWINIIKWLLKGYALYILLTAKKSDVPDLLNAMVYLSAEAKQSLSNAIETGKKGVTTVAKIGAVIGRAV